MDDCPVFDSGIDIRPSYIRHILSFKESVQEIPFAWEFFPCVSEDYIQYILIKEVTLILLISNDLLCFPEDLIRLEGIHVYQHHPGIEVFSAPS